MTSEEIAKLCGVSRATVSRVINNSPNVKEETRQKILAVIKEKKLCSDSAGTAFGRDRQQYNWPVCFWILTYLSQSQGSRKVHTFHG